MAVKVHYFPSKRHLLDTSRPHLFSFNKLIIGFSILITVNHSSKSLNYLMSRYTLKHHNRTHSPYPIMAKRLSNSVRTVCYTITELRILSLLERTKGLLRKSNNKEDLSESRMRIVSLYDFQIAESGFNEEKCNAHNFILEV